MQSTDIRAKFGMEERERSSMREGREGLTLGLFDRFLNVETVQTRSMSQSQLGQRWD
jgi:hypothetical protein